MGGRNARRDAADASPIGGSVGTGIAPCAGMSPDVSPVAPRPRPHPRPGRRRVARRRLLVAALGTLLGCSGDGGGPVGPDPVIAGDWSGSARAGLVRFEATFTQDGETVGGTGNFSSPLASDDFTVSGTVVGRDVDLVLTSDEVGATRFRGRFVAADRITGILELPGDDLELTLDRD